MSLLLRVFLLCSLALCSVSASAQTPKAKKRVVLYAQFLENTLVDLSDGSRWMMDKGDCFPVHMFKEQQTQVVLLLANATFRTEAKNVRIMKESETEAALESYRKNLNNYLKGQADKWKQQQDQQSGVRTGS